MEVEDSGEARLERIGVPLQLLREQRAQHRQLRQSLRRALGIDMMHDPQVALWHPRATGAAAALGGAVAADLEEGEARVRGEHRVAQVEDERRPRRRERLPAVERVVREHHPPQRVGAEGAEAAEAAEQDDRVLLEIERRADRKQRAKQPARCVDGCARRTLGDGRRVG